MPKKPNPASRTAPEKSSVKKPTIYDLARLAGVSAGTVSRVLNNRNRVKAETRDRILHAATELNLKPRATVRNREIAIVSEPTYPDRVEGYAATLTAHLSFALSRRSIGVLLPANPVEQLPGMFLDGVIVVTRDITVESLVTALQNRIPVVYTDKFPAEPKDYVVSSDHFGAGYLAARHFIESGKTKLAILAGDYVPSEERLKGFKQALTEAKLPIDERRTTLYSPEPSRVAAVTRLVRAGADAIYAPGSSFQALECLQILTYVMRLKVPEDIALIGGENEGVSGLLTPPLTTIQEPLREMAEKAAEMIDLLTSGQRVAKPQLMLPIQLIERGSVV